jgi:hypothetical protein
LLKGLGGEKERKLEVGELGEVCVVFGVSVVEWEEERRGREVRLCLDILFYS